MADKPTERDGLSLRIHSTVDFEFGSACDFVQRLVDGGKIDQEVGERIKTAIRTRGNNIVRIVNNHLEYFVISRNHAAEEIDQERVARLATQRLGESK